MSEFVKKAIRGALLAMMALACLGPLTHSLHAQTFDQIPQLYFTKPFGGADPLPQTIAIASTSTPINFSGTVSTSGGGNWLSVTGLYSGYLEGTTPSFAGIKVTAAVTLAAGTYNGQVVFTNGTTSMTVLVTLTVAPITSPFFDNPPGGLNFSLVTAGPNPPSQTVQIRNGGPGTLPWTLTKSTADGGNWLSVSAPSGTAPSLVTATVTTASLPNGGLLAGTFIGQLLFQAGGSSITIPVTVVVAANVLNQINPLNFTKPFAGLNPLPQVLNIASTTTPGINFSGVASTATGGSWLSVTGLYSGYLEGTTPEVAQIVVNPSVTLAAGTYTGQVVISSGSQAITVAVTLTVGAPSTPFFDNVQGAMNFSLQTAVGLPPSQTVQIRNGGTGTLTWTLTKSTADSGNWLKVSATSGTAPSLVTISITPGSLPNQALIAGTFTGEVVFTASGSSVSIPISVTVGANVLRQINSLSFTKVFGGANPLPQVLTLASTGTNINFSSTVSTGTGGNWLSVGGLYSGYLEGTAPEPALVNVNASPTLPVGTYTGEIVFSSGSQAVTVGVTLTVAAATDTFFDTVQGGMNFFMATAGTAPASQYVQIRNGGGGLLHWTVGASTADGANWLTASAPNSSAPATVTVTVTPSALPGQGLLAGTFTGELVFQIPGDMVTVPVSVTVGTSVFVQRPSLYFTKAFAGQNPLSQTLSLASTGSNISFSGTVSNSTGGNWLSITGLYSGFLEGTTPISPSAVINASTTLPNGTYTGQVVFSAGTMAMTVPVTLNVGTVPVAAPFGSFDTPANNSTVAGAVGVTGWALSYVGVASLGIYRDPVNGESGLAFIGYADFVAGARPDVAAAFPGYPYNDRGWGLQLLTNELPGTGGQAIGNGTYTLHAIATDVNGLGTDLGTKTITVNNATSSAPFGTIDTPTQGGIASGTAYLNFGWALTPQPNMIPIDGSTITVFVDNIPKGHPVYNNARADIQALFPGYKNTNGAVGYFVLDTTKLTNGLHTISWVVVDNAGHASGIGSRFFTVQN